MGVIFITEKDYYQAGKAVYMIQNMNQTLNQPFGDGAHILYVNGEYRDDSAIGKLMHDFNCADALRIAGRKNKVSQGKFEGSERDVPDNG